jgi:methanogenic corrinoid protein MtbC1
VSEKHEELIAAIVELREADAARLVKEALDAGDDPLDVVAAGKEAMDTIGAQFAACEVFIPELIMAGEIMKDLSSQVEPRLSGSGGASRLGTVVLGTVKGDIHDIGKGIVATMLTIAGFEVVDLGVDVSPEAFIAAASESGATLIALSGLLTLAIDAMKAVVAAVDEAGLREKVRIMVGGAPVTEQVCEYTGADGWGADAVAAVALAKSWVGGA